MSTDPFIAAARTRIDAEADAKRLVGKAMRDVWTDYGEYTLLPEVLAPRIVEWARDYLAEQEPTEDVVQAAVAAILALTNETEETARMDDIDVAWDHARAALTAAHATR